MIHFINSNIVRGCELINLFFIKIMLLMQHVFECIKVIAVDKSIHTVQKFAATLLERWQCCSNITGMIRVVQAVYIHFVRINRSYAERQRNGSAIITVTPVSRLRLSHPQILFFIVIEISIFLILRALVCLSIIYAGAVTRDDDVLSRQ